MTERQLNNLSKVLNRMKDECDCVSVTEYSELQREVEHELDMLRISNFKAMVDRMMLEAAVSDEAMDKLEALEFTILYNGQGVNLKPGPDVNEVISDMLGRYIKARTYRINAAAMSRRFSLPIVQPQRRQAVAGF